MLKIIMDIEQWSSSRGLDTADVHKQICKLMEEAGELSSSVLKNRSQTEIRDAIGDCVVVLTIIAQQLGTNLDTCVRQAYEEIKERRGKLINGVYVKEQDYE